MKLRLLAFLCFLLLCCGVTPAFANTLPSNVNLQFQTSSQTRVPGIGDWYTTQTSSSTDRVHRIAIEISQALLDANGGVVQVQVFDAESNGLLDEVANASDPAIFQLRAANGITVLQSQTVASGATNGTTLTFNITAVGQYQLVVANGGTPVSGDNTVGLNDDDNTYSVSVPGNSTLIGQFQGTFSPTTAIASLNFYFLVGPGQPNLRLRNFDLDSASGSPSVTYTRPSGATVAGTASTNGVWNNTGTLNTGEDTVTVSQTAPYADAGTWGITVNNVNSGNQFALEANSGTTRLVLLDQPPTTADAGNFVITPDGTLPGTIGSATDHPFSVTNFFFTNDIFNFTLTGTGANYNVQLFDAATNTALTDTDGNGQVDTGILLPNESKNYYLRVTPQAGAGASDTTRVNAVSFMDTKVAPAVITTEFVDKTTQLASSTNVSGTVYSDLNHNGSLDGAETGLATTNFFVKLVPAAGGNAVATAAVNASNGTYQLSAVTPGNYTLVLDDNSNVADTTPTLPAGTVGTEAANGIRSAVIPTQGLINQNFGRYAGGILTGRVFRDTGVGSGTANDGTINGTEPGITGVSVQLQNAAGSVTYDTAVTDGSGNYSLYVPNLGTPVRVVETNLSGFRSTGASVGNTGGTYAIASDAVTFTATAGTTYSNVNFGDVPFSTFTEDNVRVTGPGQTVFMPHVFTAGTAGSLNFSMTATAAPANSGWSNVLYRDTNGNGVVDSGELPITVPITVTAGQQIAVIVKTFVPLNASLNALETVTVSGALTYATQPSIVETLTRTDRVTVSQNSGLLLTKSVDKATARPGEDITYTITYSNPGNGPITNLVINDFTPAFTVFRSASNSALPTGLTAVTPTTPALNAAGALRWNFTGTLNPGHSGTVTFVVRLQ